MSYSIRYQDHHSHLRPHHPRPRLQAGLQADHPREDPLPDLPDRLDHQDHLAPGDRRCFPMSRSLRSPQNCRHPNCRPSFRRRPLRYSNFLMKPWLMKV